MDRHVRRRLLEDAVAEAEGHPSHQMRFLISLCGELYHGAGVRRGARAGPCGGRARRANGRSDPGRARTQHARSAGRRCRRPRGAAPSARSRVRWRGLRRIRGGIRRSRQPRDLDRRGGCSRTTSSTPRGGCSSNSTASAVEAGNPWEQAWIDFPLAELECRAGDYDAARAYAEDGAALAEQLDSPLHLSRQLYCRALVAAHVGDAATARASADESLAIAAAIHNELAAVRPKIVLAFLATTERNYAEALAHLEGLTEVALEGPYWATYPFWGDLFEALVAVGELDRAHALLADIDTHRLVSQRPGTAPVLARCRGLVLAASGQVDDGIASLEEALRLQSARPVPFERARTLLALGELQRRSRQRRTAARNAALGARDASRSSAQRSGRSARARRSRESEGGHHRPTSSPRPSSASPSSSPRARATRRSRRSSSSPYAPSSRR